MIWKTLCYILCFCGYIWAPKIDVGPAQVRTVTIVLLILLLISVRQITKVPAGVWVFSVYHVVRALVSIADGASYTPRTPVAASAILQLCGAILVGSMLSNGRGSLVVKALAPISALAGLLFILTGLGVIRLPLESFPWLEPYNPNTKNLSGNLFMVGSLASILTRRPVYSALGLAALWASGSRGALISLAIALVYSFRTRFRFVLLYAACMGALLIALVVTPELSDTNSIGRLLLWKGAIDQFLRAPLFGTGAGTYECIPWPINVQTFYSAHNTYLHLLAETGAVGCGLLVFATMRRLALQSTIFSSMFVAQAVHAMVDTTALSSATNWLYGIILGTLLGSSPERRRHIMQAEAKGRQTQSS